MWTQWPTTTTKKHPSIQSYLMPLSPFLIGSNSDVWVPACLFSIYGAKAFYAHAQGRPLADHEEIAAVAYVTKCTGLESLTVLSTQNYSQLMSSMSWRMDICQLSPKLLWIANLQKFAKVYNTHKARYPNRNGIWKYKLVKYFIELLLNKLLYQISFLFLNYASRNIGYHDRDPAI